MDPDVTGGEAGMDDPLLTIEDVTREFRVSPKSVRRRLSAGDVDGAYKRPGKRGPEWVIPRAAFARLGYPEREQAGAVRVVVPADPDDRAQYWEQRARDAEAALSSSRAAPPDTAPQTARASNRRVVGWTTVVGLLAGLVVAVLAVLLAVRDDDTTRLESADERAVAAIAGLSDPGEPVGYVDLATARLVPPGRVPVGVATPEEVDTAPRLVVVEEESATAEAVTASLADRGAQVVFESAPGEARVQVFELARSDGSQPEVEGETSPSADDLAADAASSDDVTSAEDDVTPADDAVAAGPPADAGVEVVVEPGDNFWSLSEARVAEELGHAPTNAEIATYWSQVLDANGDRLVEPGNPDLILVGQTVILPSLGS